MARSFLIVGMGRFGKHMAKSLTELGNEVLAIDISEERVNSALKYVTDARIGDATDEQFLKELGINNFDVCICAIGDNFQASLETTCLMHELGAQYVFARANRDIHKKFLLRNGADEVLYAEKETAKRFAMRFGSEGVHDYFNLNDKYAIYEVSVPESWVGKNLIENNVRQKYHINVLAVKQDNDFNLAAIDHRFTEDERLLVMGTMEAIKKMRK